MQRCRHHHVCCWRTRRCSERSKAVARAPPTTEVAARTARGCRCFISAQCLLAGAPLVMATAMAMPAYIATALLSAGARASARQAAQPLTPNPPLSSLRRSRRHHPLPRRPRRRRRKGRSRVVVAVAVASDGGPQALRGSGCARCCNGAGAGGEMRGLMTSTMRLAAALR